MALPDDEEEQTQEWIATAKGILLSVVLGALFWGLIVLLGIVIRLLVLKEVLDS